MSRCRGDKADCNPAFESSILSLGFLEGLSVMVDRGNLLSCWTFVLGVRIPLLPLFIAEKDYEYENICEAKI